MQNPLLQKLGGSFHDSRIFKKKILSIREMCQTMWTNDSHVHGTMQGGSTKGELADVLTRAPSPPIIFALDIRKLLFLLEAIKMGYRKQESNPPSVSWQQHISRASLPHDGKVPTRG